MAGASAAIWFENPQGGQLSRIVVVQNETGGRQFVFEYINQPFRGEDAVPAHVHSASTETFEILKGRARYRLGTQVGTAVAGDRVVRPARRCLTCIRGATVASDCTCGRSPMLTLPTRAA